MNVRCNFSHPDAYTIQAGQLSIHLKLRGVISYFTTRKPTMKEMQDTNKYPHIEMTSLEPWDSYNEHLGDDEHQLSLAGNEYHSSNQNQRLISLSNSNLCSISHSFDEDNFLSRIINKVIVSVTNTNRKGTVTAKELAEKWFIGLNTAQQTIDQSTQRGVRDFTLSEGTKRMKHTAHQLMYRHIRASVYTDTMC
jgi:hypothetical protein